MDLTAGIRPVRRDYEDDFDYVYHLPHANITNLVRRDPFKKKQALKDASEIRKSMDRLSVNSKHSIKDIRSMLDPNATKNAGPLKVNRRHDKKVKNTTNGLSGISGSSLNMCSQSIGSMMTDNKLSAANLHGAGGRGTLKPLGGLSGIEGSISAQSKFSFVTSSDKNEQRCSVFEEDDMLLVPLDSSGVFRALPTNITKHVPAGWVAFWGLIIMVLSIVQVIVGISS